MDMRIPRCDSQDNQWRFELDPAEQRLNFHALFPLLFNTDDRMGRGSRGYNIENDRRRRNLGSADKRDSPTPVLCLLYFSVCRFYRGGVWIDLQDEQRGSDLDTADE